MVGLISSSIGALCTTMWGVSSCRYAFVDFDSDRGDFGEFYLDPTPDGPVIQFRAGVGLFTWLEPFDSTDWSQGSCTGYTELQTNLFADTTFEVARIFAVLSVLTGIGVVIWTLFLSCISLGKYQIWTMSTIFGVEAIFVALTMLIFASDLCHDTLVAQLSDGGTDNQYEAGCTLDQGGLVVIAAILLWCVSFLISVMYVKPPERDMTFVNGQITNAFEQRKKERKLHQLLAQQRREQVALRSKSAPRSDDPNNGNVVMNNATGEAEISLSEYPSHRGRNSNSKRNSSSSSSQQRKSVSSWFGGRSNNTNEDPEAPSPASSSSRRSASRANSHATSSRSHARALSPSYGSRQRSLSPMGRPSKRIDIHPGGEAEIINLSSSGMVVPSSSRSSGGGSLGEI